MSLTQTEREHIHELSQRVQALERQVRFLMQHTGAVFVDPGPAPGRFDEVLALLHRGNKIAAVKLYKDMTGVGLAEAKDAVEKLARDNGIV